MNKKHSLITTLSEKSIDFVPVSQHVDIEALKAGDTEPLEVVVEVPASTSKRGWYYTEKAIKDIVDKVNKDTLNGFLGHQKPDNVDTEFPDIQTHWIGAKFDEAKKVGYFRGVIDPDAKKLKRWVRSKRIKQVSIFGQPELSKDSSGKISVTGYKAMSIDWTPLDRCGMPTRIVASGEMSIDSFVGEFEGTDVTSSNDEEQKINTFISSIKQNYTGFKVLEVDKNKNNITIAFKDSDNTYKTKNLKYDNINQEGSKGGDVSVEKSEILKNLRIKYLEGDISDSDLSEILKLTNKSIIGNAIVEEIGEMTVEDIKNGKDAVNTLNLKNKDEIFNAVVKELVTGEQAQKFISETFKTNEVEKDKIKAEMENYLKLESISNVLNTMNKVSSPNMFGTSSGSSNGGYLSDNKFLVKRK